MSEEQTQQRGGNADMQIRRPDASNYLDGAKDLGWSTYEKDQRRKGKVTLVHRFQRKDGTKVRRHVITVNKSDAEATLKRLNKKAS